MDEVGVKLDARKDITITKIGNTGVKAIKCNDGEK
jgi:hypothetical protein